jgi:AraC-like DNA-binding protein
MKIALTVSTKVFRNAFIMERFVGSDDIFALVETGSFYVNGKEGKYNVKKNEGFLFRKNVLYDRRVTEPVTMYLFRYESETKAFDREYIVFQDQDRISSTLSMLSKLESGIIENDFELRSNLFADIVTQYAIENSLQQVDDAVIESAMDFIKRNFHHALDLRQIARHTELSYVQFLRRFKKHTGITPSDYIYSLRIQKAKSLLTDTDLLIKDISAACGFENEYYFSNFFKKHIKMSPSDFRNATQV